MRSTRRYILFFTLTITALSAHAQYHSNGQDPASTRWREFDDARYRILYPRENERDARRVAAVLDTAYGPLHYGFTRPARRLPIVLHTLNLRSNGMVVWAPRRAELIAAPPTDTYAVPWLKQLTTHEYRHAVQMSNLDRGLIHVASYLIGEQAVGAAAGFLPKWFLEGDAVLAETAMSAYGRALQPEFTVAYRALLADGGTEQFPLDKWFSGSMRRPLPDHYQYGYQLVNAGYRRYGGDMWERIYEFTARRPYLIQPRQVAVKKLFGTSSGKLFRETFGALKARWDSLPPMAESMRLVPTQNNGYTVYSHPLPVDPRRVVAHKSDPTRGDRLVAVDPATGSERLLARTGALSSRPVQAGGELFWTEYRPSTFWEQRNRSVLRRMPVDGSRRAAGVRLAGNLFYVTPFGEGFAAVDYDPVAKYAVVLYDADFQEINRLKIPAETSVHGLAWDEKTATLAAILLREEGMNLERILPEEHATRPITPPSFTAINHLRAGGGRLFFNSIGSGRDESHAYDLERNKEYRLSASKFGSIMPTPDAMGRTLAQATYRRDGYRLSTQPLENFEEEVASGARPVDLFNPPVYDPGLPNLDTMRLFPAADTRRFPSRRYRKGLNLFTVHSWAPLSFDAFEIADRRNPDDIGLGATILSQNALSNTEAFLSVGAREGNPWWRGGMRLSMWAPKIEIRAEYDGGNRGVLIPAGVETVLPGNWNAPYFSVEGRVSLPVDLSSGATVRGLTPSLALAHTNTMFYRRTADDFTNGFQQLEFSLAYAQSRRMAPLDLVPRLGFGGRTTAGSAPWMEGFGTLWSFSGHVYLPGAAVNHSLLLRGAYQRQHAEFYSFRSAVNFPRGAAYDFAPERLGSVLADYYFPIAYPDGGIDGVLYIKRLSADVFGGAARYRPVGAKDWEWAHSYGVELRVDFVPLRLSGTDFIFLATLYRTGDRDGLNASAGFTVSF